MIVLQEPALAGEGQGWGMGQESPGTIYNPAPGGVLAARNLLPFLCGCASHVMEKGYTFSHGRPFRVSLPGSIQHTTGETMDESPETTIGTLLKARGLKLAIAESCTGGLTAHRLTNIPGSSEYFLGGVVAYAYEAKVALLNVSWDTLRSHGAVSRETAIEMARGVRTALGAGISISITGIAGPGGGLPDKPVGTTWIGLSANDGDWARKFTWSGDRVGNKEASTNAALQFILDYLNGNASST